jgi:hypothetical protein
MRHRRFATALGLVFVLAWTVACAGFQQKVQQQVNESNDLQQIGAAWQRYLSSHSGTAPSRPEDVFPDLGGPTSAASQGLTSGKYVFFWDVGIGDMTTGQAGTPTSRVILGYVANAPTNGGMVLMGDGTVKHMSSHEISTTKKASDFQKKKK